MIVRCHYCNKPHDGSEFAGGNGCLGCGGRRFRPASQLTDEEAADLLERGADFGAEGWERVDEAVGTAVQ